jgi:hypothetical protein
MHEDHKVPLSTSLCRILISTSTSYSTTFKSFKHLAATLSCHILTSCHPHSVHHKAHGVRHIIKACGSMVCNGLQQIGAPQICLQIYPSYLAISWLVNIIIIISTRDTAGYWARLVQLRQAEQSQKPARIFSPNVWLEDVLDCSLCLDAEARCKWRGSGRTFVVATLPFWGRVNQKTKQRKHHRKDIQIQHWQQ